MVTPPIGHDEPEASWCVILQAEAVKIRKPTTRTDHAVMRYQRGIWTFANLLNWESLMTDNARLKHAGPQISGSKQRYEPGVA